MLNREAGRGDRYRWVRAAIWPMVGSWKKRGSCRRLALPPAPLRREGGDVEAPPGRRGGNRRDIWSGKQNEYEEQSCSLKWTL